MRAFIFVLMLLAFAPILPAIADDAMPSMSMPMAAPENGPETVTPPNAKQVYICPMHPHIHGKKGDKCPICGMTLVPQDETQPMSMPPEGDGKTAPDTPTPDQSGVLRITPTYRQALGVKTGIVALHEFGKAIHAPGSIVPSTRREYTVAVRTGGWITGLKTDAVGDVVKKGDLLFTFYSPDLLSAQADYMVGQRGEKVIGAPDQRLRLYGMDDKAIAELKEKGRFLEQTPFYAPTDGTVTMLNVRKGSYIDPQAGGNTTVLTLQDFSQVWVMAQVPVKDLQFLAAGTPATVTVDETGETAPAVIDYIYPTTDNESHDGMARLVLDNPDGKLKTGSLVNVMFKADSQKRLAVPEDAVLYGKDSGYVMEALGNGYFRPVMVKTGITADGLTEIVSGLKEGQNIVTSGQFMIDAESNLRGGMDNMAGMDMKTMDGGNDHAH